MKTLGIILAVLLVIIGLALVGLQMFLTKGLTTTLNQGVFPAVKGMYGLEMSITNASVNLFKGDALLEGFTVRNLAGYEEPALLTFDTCRLELDLMSLIKRNPVIIDLAEAQGATLVIERNKEKKFNVKELADALKPAESTETPATQKQVTQKQADTAEPAPTTPPAEPVKAPPVPVHIRRLAIDSTVKYVDSGRDKTYSLNLRLTGSDLFTVPAEDQPDSLLVLRGSLAHKEDSFVTDLNAILKPLTDPQNPTFNATGSILDIDADFLGDLLRKNKMESSTFSVKPSITCEKGMLTGSRIDLVLNELKMYGTDIGDTTLKLPLNGTLRRPSLDITGAIQSLFSEQGLNIGKTLGLRELGKQLGIGTNTTANGMVMEGLTNNVKEIAESPALQNLIQQIVPGTQSTNAAVTNQSLGEAVGNVLSEQLGKNVKELEGNEAVKNTLKNLGTSLFGK
jgi:hypothetical protein